MSVTLATPANMRAFADAHPSRTITTPEGGTAIVEGARCFAFSPLTGEEGSASAGDYFALPENQPLLDSEGEPMILARRCTTYIDALTGETV